MSKPPAQGLEPEETEHHPQMSDALIRLHAAAQVVQSLERDKSYLPSPRDLAILERLIDELWFYQGSLRSIYRALKRRAGGEEGEPDFLKLFREN